MAAVAAAAEAVDVVDVQQPVHAVDVGGAVGVLQLGRERVRAHRRRRVSSADGYWLGWLVLGRVVGRRRRVVDGVGRLVGVAGMMYCLHRSSQAALNGAQSPVTRPYSASSHSQKLNASDVVSWPWSGASTISVSTEWYGTPSGQK